MKKKNIMIENNGVNAFFYDDMKEYSEMLIRYAQKQIEIIQDCIDGQFNK